MTLGIFLRTWKLWVKVSDGLHTDLPPTLEQVSAGQSGEGAPQLQNEAAINGGASLF